MKVQRLDHVQLACPPGSEKEARRFFAGLLGLVEQQKPALLAQRGGCWFGEGDCQIHVGVEDPFLPQKKAHLALVVEDLDEAADCLSEAGHPVQWDSAIPDVRRFYTEDPFGNRLELLDRSIPTKPAC